MANAGRKREPRLPGQGFQYHRRPLVVGEVAPPRSSLLAQLIGLREEAGKLGSAVWTIGGDRDGDGPGIGGEDVTDEM